MPAVTAVLFAVLTSAFAGAPVAAQEIQTRDDVTLQRLEPVSSAPVSSAPVSSTPVSSAPVLSAPVSSTAVDTSATRAPLFSSRDAWLAGGFAIAAVAVAPFDQAIADRMRDPSIQSSTGFRRMSQGLGYAGHPGVLGVTVGLFTYGHIAGDRRAADMGMHAAQAVLLGEGLTYLGKAVTGRARPRSLPDDPYRFALGRGFEGGSYRSFPSAHATAVFALASAITTELSLHESDHTSLAGVLMFGGASLVAASRLYDDEHWASDVIVGAAVGTFSGWKLVSHQHNRPEGRLERIFLPVSVVPHPDGMMLVATIRF